MESLQVILVVFSALVLSAKAQTYADAGKEPWAEIVSTACNEKEIDIQDVINTHVNPCINNIMYPSDVVDSSAFAICNVKEERVDCLKPYYEKIKECFHSKEAKDQVNLAFIVTKATLSMVCDQESLKDLLKHFDPECAAKMHELEAVGCKSRVSSPDIEEIFNDNNCKMMDNIQDCNLEALKTCNNRTVYDYVRFQYEFWMLGECPPLFDGGSSTVVFTTLMLVSSLFVSMFRQVINFPWP